MNLYWGDIHNHNAVGYAKGSLERSIEIAKSHLDFFAFTGHSQWHDIKKYESDAHMHWIKGFKEHKNNWDNICNLIANYYTPGEFATFLGYEWHSSTYGDYCIIYKDDFKELKFLKDINALREHAKNENALLIPHHIGYKQGHRGLNIDYLNEEYTPVVEIFSEHGLCETDDGPFEMISHSMGGRCTENTYQNVLKKGYKIGAVASTDDHLGYPGAYGEGLTAVYAENLDRNSIMDAILNKRTYAVTGDRIKLDFKINGSPMGSVIKSSNSRNIEVDVDCWDTIWMIELIKNNNVLTRWFPDADKTPENNLLKTRIEYGWGPWNDLSIERICDWDISLNLTNGKITDYCPCFQSGPFDENRRNKIISKTDNNINWISYTSRKDAYLKRPTNSIAFEIKTDENLKDSYLNLEINKPVKLNINVSLAELSEKTVVEFTGDFPKESIKIHRAISTNMYKDKFKYEDIAENTDNDDFYYVRVTQRNGQMAISSPIWVENR